MESRDIVVLTVARYFRETYIQSDLTNASFQFVSLPCPLFGGNTARADEGVHAAIIAVSLAARLLVVCAALYRIVEIVAADQNERRHDVSRGKIVQIHVLHDHDHY